MDVPCYLSTPGCAPAHSHFVLDPRTNLPTQIPGNTMQVDFRCRIPQVALENPGASRPSLYGHGLFGGYGEVGQGQLKNMMAEHNFTYCATAWAGMATEDVPNVATILPDASSFNTLGRPRPAGDAQLPLPRPADDPPAGPVQRRRRSTSAASASSTRAACSTTATARAASSAAR